MEAARGNPDCWPIMDLAVKLTSDLAKSNNEIERLTAELEEYRTECLEQSRLNGMGSEREAKLMAELAEALRDNEVLDRVIDKLGQRIMNLEAALKQGAEQCQHTWVPGNNGSICKHCGVFTPASAEPVACHVCVGSLAHVHRNVPIGTKLYARPAPASAETCRANEFSSACCTNGTKGCNVKHPAPASAEKDAALRKAREVLVSVNSTTALLTVLAIDAAMQKGGAV